VPTSIYTPEIASAFGALDSAAVSDGGALTAHVIRAVSRSVNRLLAKPETVLSAVYPTRGGTLEALAPTGRGYPFWARVESWPIYSRSDRRSLDVRLMIQATSGDVLQIQLCTSRSPFVAAPLAGDYKTLTATGGYDVVEWDGLATAGGDDELTLYIRGALSSTLGNTATYGSPNTGTVQEVTSNPGGIRTSALTAWNNTSLLATWAWTHVLVILSGSVLLTDPRLIVGVVGNAPEGQLELYPTIPINEADALRRTTYEIRTCPLWRIAAIHAITSLRASL
jgi:hypothetical protein